MLSNSKSIKIAEYRNYGQEQKKLGGITIEYECLARVNRSDHEFKRVNLTTSNNLPGRRVWVTLPDYPIPILGFYSYDRKGVVYQKPKSMYYAPWQFIRIFRAVPVCQGGLSTKRNIGFMTRFNLCLHLAIQIENKVCLDLYNAGFPEDDIIHLPHSGIKSGGTDIVIGWADGYRNKKMPNRIVHQGMLAIEVLGLNYHYGNKPKFTYSNHKDFKIWMNDCYAYHTIPIIAWIEDSKPWYMIMHEDDKELEDIFFTSYNFKKYGYRQRKGLAPVWRTKPYRIDNKAMYECFKE